MFKYLFVILKHQILILTLALFNVTASLLGLAFLFAVATKLSVLYSVWLGPCASNLAGHLAVQGAVEILVRCTSLAL